MEYLWGAYSAIWLVIFGYLLLLGKRHKNLKKEIDFLRQLEK
ncbi:MAG TPA: CcmD family protein [Bacillales bacterium]|jgi:CcmD family protein|nr:CcmD family protein [Bacillales bacterium]